MTPLNNCAILALNGGDVMAVGEDKVRTNITFPKELKEKIDTLAKKDNRSFNNLVIKILGDYINKK